MNKEQKSIFIDCSYLYHHTELNTGIQRVVRQIVQNLVDQAATFDYQAQPVVLENGRFHPIDSSALYPTITDQNTAPPEAKSAILAARVRRYFEHVYAASIGLVYALLPFGFMRRFLYAPKETFGFNFIVYSILFKPFQRSRPNPSEQEPASIDFREGDVLLLADSTWYMDIWPSVKTARDSGARIVSVIYDLIPITHPQYCDSLLVEVFKKWFFDSLDHVDGYIAISQTVQKDLQSFMRREFGTRADSKSFDFFWLGSDFHHEANLDQSVRRSLLELFHERPTYLIVCTVEPRKNHWYLLDVFDRLWSMGREINLCIVGRVGWKIEETMSRIMNHDQLDERLHYFHDLNDKELEYCYSHSRMLLFPSVVEGFGLPIVESLMHRLPVLASDTPIHREIGGDRIGYFDIGSTDSLVDRIITIEREGLPRELVVDEDYRWLSWSDSTAMLLDKMLRILEYPESTGTNRPR